MDDTFDLALIGGESAEIIASILPTHANKKTFLIEKNILSGEIMTADVVIRDSFLEFCTTPELVVLSLMTAIFCLTNKILFELVVI